MKHLYRNIGSGKLPNKYYVTSSNDFLYAETPGSYTWISEVRDFDLKVGEHGIFNTYAEAYQKVQEIIADNIGDHPTKNGINSIFIEDHLTGEVFSTMFYATPIEDDFFDQQWEYEFEEYEDYGFTKVEMEKAGYTFK